MVKTATDLKRLARQYVSLAAGIAEIERLLAVEGVDPTEKLEDEVWLLVVSETFAALSMVDRISLLATITPKLDAYTTAWGFTPDEYAQSREGRGGHPFLGMMLNQSREIYTAPQLTRMQEDGHD